MTLPDWPPRDWRAYIALLGSILGAMVLTMLLAWIIHHLAGWRQAHPLANIAYGLLAIIGVVLMSLGLAINRRTLQVKGLGVSLDASGGEDSDSPAPAAAVTTTTTTVVPSPPPSPPAAPGLNREIQP